MGSEVRHYINILLEEAEIYPDRIEIMKLAKYSGFDDLLYFSDSSSITKSMIAHEPQIVFFCKVHQFLSLSYAGGQRLFDKNMFATFHAGLSDGKMGVYRCGNSNGIHFIVSQDFLQISCFLNTWIRTQNPFQSLFVQIT
jgi:hypothetical protein